MANLIDLKIDRSLRPAKLEANPNTLDSKQVFKNCRQRGRVVKAPGS